jgi:signal transduction histidine kinase/DNA-binding NarL/FixJ family response regulator
MLTESPAAPLILLVEDDPGHAAAIQRSFEDSSERYRLVIAGTLHDARIAIKELHPALVLTDYRLPDGDGSDLAHMAHEAWPMILMTAKGSEEIAVQVLKAGVQDYVVKSAETFAHMPETVNHSLKAWALVQARKQAEKALRESEEKHRLLYERMSLAAKTACFGVWDWDIATDEATWDDTMFEIYGIPKTSPVPLETLIDIVYPGDFACVLETLKHQIDKGGREVEFKIVRPDGEVRHIYSVEGFIRNEDNEVIRIVGVNTDITERKQAEEALRSYARRLIEMEEALRKKIATELHDEIARDLTVIGMNFSIISSTLAHDESKGLQARIEDSARLIEGISRNTRNIMAGLRPPVLDDYGLAAALRWHSELFSARTGIAVTLQADEFFPRLQPEVELALFRISQEALMNAAKHASAKAMTLTLTYEPDMVQFIVVDNGKGLPPHSDSHAQGSGWGLTIMQERAELVGGRFAIDSSPGQGTTVTVEIPLEEI